MQRALTSAVSGMLNNQLVMETTANNLANVNTSGFKASRVSFATALVQTSFSGSGAGSAIGGRNPRQTGLGMTSNSVDLDMRQGSIQSTGRGLDLAVQGDGFFEVTNGATSAFTRVGNFAFDSSDNLVDAGTGMRLVGNTYNPRPNPDGSQSITAIGVPLQIDRSAAFPPKQTEEVTFNGNLSPTARALRGFNLTSTYPLVNTLTGKVATEDTKLSDLNIFNEASGNPGDTITMNVFGTTPDGEAYGAQFELHPWDTPTIANNQIGSVSELILKLSNALSQGSDRFGSVRLDNGNLVASGVGDGDNFSMFLGEGTSAFGGANAPIAGLAATPTYTGTPSTPTTYTIAAGQEGLLNPAFVLDAVGTDFSAQVGTNVRIALSVNGVERGSITIPAANYVGATLAERTFRLPSFPHVDAGDVVTIDFTGAMNIGSTLDYTTAGIRDSDPLNLTADADTDGEPDMFQDGSAIDPNAWVYENGTNTTFDWYRARVVPETVASSIDVFDAQGGKHTVEARFFRTGSRTDSATGAVINNWDMMVNAADSEGTILNGVVAGIEFDQNGRFTGSVGTSSRGTAFNDASYVGNPGAGSVQIDWLTTGPTDPTSIAMNFGAANSVNGLTGFGGPSTATAIDQDGYEDGTLDSISVSSEGDIVGMYTNGVSLKLAQLQLATFRNPAGLIANGSNMFVESANSGSASRRVAGQGSGFITAGALEGGNVDIATEFTRIITAQRGFQVNARVIQTTDSLLEELANLIR
jgi:flagellar hook protein FlgE